MKTVADPLTSRILEMGKRGFSSDMIIRTIKRDSGKTIHAAAVHAALAAAGIEDHRDDPMERSEMQYEEDPDELRARWAKMLPKMKKAIRAEAGGQKAPK